MSKLFSPGVIAAACTFAGVIATAYKAAPVAAFFNDPTTPGYIIAIIGGAGALISGLLPNHSATTATDPALGKSA